MIGHLKNPYHFNFSYGFLGVHLFFIISGYVIYMSILNCNNTKDFLIKRVVRLYPAYIVSSITNLYYC